MKYFDNRGNLKDKIEYKEDEEGEEYITAGYEAEKLVKEGKVNADSDAAHIYYTERFDIASNGICGVRSLYERTK